MVRVLENEFIAISVAEKGAELSSVQHKKTGKELMWNANPDVWNRHAPLLFPYCGGLFNDEMTVNGKKYPAPKHGFARNMNFTCILADAEALVFQLQANDETKQVYPFDFVLEVKYTLDGDTVNQQVTVTNSSKNAEQILPFTLGFHPGFVIPFGESNKTSDYEIYFDHAETPMEIKTPNGYVSGEQKVYFTEQQILPLHDALFATDSICLTGLQSSSISVRESERPSNYIRVNTKNFPNVLLWSAAVSPMQFVCIEPWVGLPDGPDEYGEFKNKPGNILLSAQQSYATTLQMQFHVE